MSKDQVMAQLIAGVADVVRDTGHTMYCRACSLAEPPWRDACRGCGGDLELLSAERAREIIAEKRRARRAA